MYCYRHPDRETMVSCSECGRGDLPRVHGFRAGRDPLPRPLGTAAGSPARHAECPPRQLRGHRRDRHEGSDRAERRRLPARARGRRRDQRHRQPDLHRGRPLRPVRRRRRLVAPVHLDVPPLRTDPPRVQHARALVVRLRRRAGARARPLPAPLHRLGPGRSRRRADLLPGEPDGGRLRRAVRDPRRGRSSSSGKAPMSSAAARSGSSRSTSSSRSRSRDLDRRPSRRARRRRPSGCSPSRASVAPTRSTDARVWSA